MTKKWHKSCSHPASSLKAEVTEHGSLASRDWERFSEWCCRPYDVTESSQVWVYLLYIIWCYVSFLELSDRKMPHSVSTLTPRFQLAGVFSRVFLVARLTASRQNWCEGGIRSDTGWVGGFTCVKIYQARRWCGLILFSDPDHKYVLGFGPV